MLYRKRLLLFIASLVIYIGIQFVSCCFFNTWRGEAIAIPIIVSGILFGLKPTVVITLLLQLPLNLLLCFLFQINIRSTVISVAGFSGGAAILLFGCVVGYIHDLNIQRQKELKRLKEAEGLLETYRGQLELVVDEKTFELSENEQQIHTLLEETQQGRRALLSILEDDREVHASLQQSEEQYRSVVETATDAIITVDSVGNIVLWNRAAAQIFGYESSEICGAPLSILFSKDVEDEDIRSLLAAVKSGVLPTPLTVNEVVALKKDSTQFPIEIAFGVITQDKNRHITAIIRDITERKLIEHQALRTAQLVSIGELAAGVAHEINNPIMGVINYAQIMLNTNQTQGGNCDIPVRIIKEGERIAAIVSNLLNLARPADVVATPVTVREIFEPALQLMSKRIQQSDIVVDAQFGDDLPCVMVIPQKIQQVFINLISNAIFALNERFPDFHADKRLEVHVEDFCETNEKLLRVVFLDRGCGIPSEDIIRICNPFFSTKPRGKGTGLGLSICHEIINQHGGRLLFESVLGEYTRVLIDLPTESIE